MITARTLAESYDPKAVSRRLRDDRQLGRPKAAQHLQQWERVTTYILARRKTTFHACSHCSCSYPADMLWKEESDGY